MKPKKTPPVFPPGSIQAAAQALGRLSAGKPRNVSFEERRRRAEWMRGMAERMAEKSKNQLDSNSHS